MTERMTNQAIPTPGLADLVRAEHIYKDERFSDHAPLIMDYEFEITRS